MTNFARIISINATGYMKIRFKDRLEKPKDLDEIDQRRVSVSIYYEFEEYSEPVNYKLLSISKDTMLFKLYFRDIDDVSKY